MLTSYFCLCIFLKLFVVKKASANAAYCDNGFCSSPDKYCCGPNECCTYVYTMWYLWLTFTTVVFAIAFFLWKYYLQMNKVKFFSTDSPLSMSFFSKLDHRSLSNNISSNKSNTVPFIPLRNNEVFVEQQVDENTIMVGF